MISILNTVQYDLKFVWCQGPWYCSWGTIVREMWLWRLVNLSFLCSRCHPHWAKSNTYSEMFFVTWDPGLILFLPHERLLNVLTTRAWNRGSSAISVAFLHERHASEDKRCDPYRRPPIDALTDYQNKEPIPEATTPTFMNPRTISTSPAMGIHYNRNLMHSRLTLCLRQSMDAQCIQVSNSMWLLH